MTFRVRVVTMLVLVALLLGSTPGLGQAKPAAQDRVAALLLAARTDLETVANERLGDGYRPAMWSNAIDVNSPTFALDLRLDLETLTGVLGGPDWRPEGWFGAVPGTLWAQGRDIRHDLELLAENQFGIGVRPALWIGGDAVMRCDRDVQAVAYWFDRTNVAYTLPEGQPGPEYCALVEQQNKLFADIVIQDAEPAGDLRADLNALSRVVFRENVFPIGWTDGKDNVSVRQDMELLKAAASQVGQPIDEASWLGGEGFAEAWEFARANRHDLELLADAKAGIGQRPEGWTAFEPLVRCPIAVQEFALLMQAEAGLVPVADPAAADYCGQIVVDFSRFVEDQVSAALAPPPVPAAGDGAVDSAAAAGGEPAVTATVGNIAAVAQNPAAYLDRGARIRVGAIPRGTPFTALARNSTPDSSMVYVTGEGFTTWISYRFTSLSDSEYQSLPFAEHVEYQLPQLVCFAIWCTDLVRYGDPMGGVIGYDGLIPPGRSSVAAPGANLRQLDYAHVRLLFNRHDTPNNQAELRIEICPNLENYNGCEPVLRLIENGQVVQPVRVENGYPIWRLHYELHDPTRLESRRYFVNGLWVSRP
ncbi:MAG: hypothetical protein JXN59_10470 [Anaerolineae bacterium]|nr:hypothetical protein [Anaerolineae bacterium]